MPNSWDGAANLGGVASGTSGLRQIDRQSTANLGAGIALGTDGGLRQIDRQSAANLAASGSISAIGYSASLFSALVDVLETEADVTAQRDAISALVAYHAAVAAQSVQDRASLAHSLARHTKDIDLILNYLLGKFGPAGLPLDKPSADQLAEIEVVVGAKRAASNLDPLPGTSF